MKVSREQAAENRKRIIDVAGRLFRERGFDGIGVADLMQAAGLTHGGFYGHFGSKDDLAAEACGRALGRSAEKWAALADGSGDALAALVKHYVSERHRDAPGSGCVLASLGADAARQGQPIRQALTEGLGSLIAILAKVVPGRSRAARRRAALAALAEMVGAIMLARTVDDRNLSNEILAAAVSDLTGRRR
jgi:TetR/AcrR family transcriptional regulator, transcriptional repressor for nem operon